MRRKSTFNPFLMFSFNIKDAHRGGAFEEGNQPSTPVFDFSKLCKECIYGARGFEGNQRSTPTLDFQPSSISLNPPINVFNIKFRNKRWADGSFPSNAAPPDASLMINSEIETWVVMVDSRRIPPLLAS